MKLISVTMKLFFWEKFHCDLRVWKMGGLESLNFDFGVINFDTMKLIFSAIVSQILMPQGFLYIEKERKLQYLWYHNFRSYVVRVAGLEPTASWTRTMRATSCATPGNLLYYNRCFPFCQVDAWKCLTISPVITSCNFTILTCKRLAFTKVQFCINEKFFRLANQCQL